MLPEGIPFPGTRFYSFLARSRIMQAFYKDVALDVAEEVSGGRILDVAQGRVTCPSGYPKCFRGLR